MYFSIVLYDLHVFMHLYTGIDPRLYMQQAANLGSDSHNVL